jgi:glucokinase
MDLGATNTKMVVLHDDGETLRIDRIPAMPTAGGDGHDAVIARLITACEEHNAAHGPLAGLGVGTPGLFDADGVVTLFTNLPGQWKGVRLRERLTEAVRLPVTLINDARAFTLAEGTIGAGSGCSVLVCMTLGTGIGGGVMIDGEPFFGATGVAGEIAHQTVNPGGPVCGCGNQGCAEPMARADVLCATAGQDTVEAVFAGLAEDDARCIEAVRTAATYLGIALANAITLIGPERIVLGGGVMAAGDAILGPIREATYRHVTLVPHQDVQIVPAALGSEAGAIGAALAARSAATS